MIARPLIARPSARLPTGRDGADSKHLSHDAGMRAAGKPTLHTHSHGGEYAKDSLYNCHSDGPIVADSLGRDLLIRPWKSWSYCRIEASGELSPQ